MSHTLVWIIAAGTILLILVRPKQIPEAVWAACGALLLIILRLISRSAAFYAAKRGTDVYLFLAGMMMLAELARREGLFDSIAVIAVEAAKSSRTRLFALVYGAGTVVTIFLSNDATAVVLTPAVLAAVKKAKAKPLPFLFVCAFIANAASFVLPISNPANLVVYGSKMPPLVEWFRLFGLPSLVSIGMTFVVLRWSVRKDLEGVIESNLDRVKLTSAGKRAAYGVVAAAVALILASAFNIHLGLPTFVAASAATLLVSFKDRSAPLCIVKDISWSVLPLVAGLFILVQATNQAGALGFSTSALRQAANLTLPLGSLSAAFGLALASNIANNLPVGLIAASALRSAAVSNEIRNAVLIGVDLGPNLSVTGSLATILWLMALRRDGENVRFWDFLRLGVWVMTPTLALTVLSSLLTTH